MDKKNIGVDQTQDKNYQRYVNSAERKRATGITKELRMQGGFGTRMAADLLTNGRMAPAPGVRHNQRKVRRIRRQLNGWTPTK